MSASGTITLIKVNLLLFVPYYCNQTRSPVEHSVINRLNFDTD